MQDDWDQQSYHEEEPEENSFVDYDNIFDSRTSQIDDELNEKLENAFHAPTSQFLLHEIAKIASEHDPIDLAYAATKLPTMGRYVIYENLPDLQSKMIFMINVGSNTRSAIFRQIRDQEISDLLENMPPDEAVWMLDDMSDRRMRRILRLLTPKKAARVIELQKHERHSAGRLMTNEFFAFPMETTIGEVAAAIRNNPGIDLTRWIFVLGPNGELVGYVPERNLIVNPDNLPLRQVMRPILHKVSPETPRDEVVDLVERYKIPALPVVNANEFLVGVVTYEDVVEAMEDIADKTITSIAGTAEDISEHEPIGRRFLWRAPWLIVTLFAGVTSSAILSHFSDRLWFAIVPFFVPLIAGMSGKVGIQCSTLLVRGMSTGELSLGSRGEAAVKELGIGLLIGVFFGILCGSVVYTLSSLGAYPLGADPIALGITVSSGLFAACIVATSLGTFSPFFFSNMNIDPAVASGPIVTAFNDVLTTIVFIFTTWSVNILLQ